MDQIIVTIPPQQWDNWKYIGGEGMCYLHEALHNAGYEGVDVLGEGLTYIGKDTYIPTEKFNARTVKQAFGRGESITVTLKKQ